MISEIRIIISLLLLISFASSAEQMHPQKEQFTLTSYQNNYVLPYYSSTSPNQAYFEPQNPNDSKVNKTSVQFQLSLKYGLVANMFSNNDGLYFSYTQLSNWQAYDKSAYFKDTDYKPEIFWVFIHNQAIAAWTFSQTQLGLEHQSNGKGGIYERSWNRAYMDFTFTENTFSLNIKPWLRLRVPSSRDYNPDILHFMGNGHIGLSWQQGKHKLSLNLRNQIESNFSRGYEALSWRFPIYQKLNGYIKAESGYGLTISNYNHYDNALGIGISL